MKVRVDPGHYGRCINQSPVDKTYYESATVWVLGNYVAEELRKLGVQADLSRNSIDQEVPLVTRGTDSKGYDLFVSIHTNATGNSQGSDAANWPVCYVQVSGASTEIGNRIGKALMPLFNANKWECYSVKNANGQDWYGVLRGAASVGTPGLIVEHGFHTCPANVALLKQDSFLRKLAQTDAKVIYEYLGGQTIVNPSSNMLYGVVVNVPKNDTLNVRIGPGANYDLLKEYAHLGNGNQIDIVGRDDTQKWLYIRIEGKYFGWVNRSYVKIV